MTYTAHTSTAGITFAQRFGALRATMTEALAKRKVYRTTIAELDNLSNRDLADLGLSRSMIKGIAFEAAYGN